MTQEVSSPQAIPAAAVTRNGVKLRDVLLRPVPRVVLAWAAAVLLFLAAIFAADITATQVMRKRFDYLQPSLNAISRVGLPDPQLQTMTRNILVGYSLSPGAPGFLKAVEWCRLGALLAVNALFFVYGIRFWSARGAFLLMTVLLARAIDRLVALYF